MSGGLFRQSSFPSCLIPKEGMGSPRFLDTPSVCALWSKTPAFVHAPLPLGSWTAAFRPGWLFAPPVSQQNVGSGYAPIARLNT